ncbi:hypothetical protein [Paenibacillus pinihumi]|nr:hypothetical protein [Paenibacillus pinihumi]
MNIKKLQSGAKKSEKIRIEIRELPSHLIEKALADYWLNKAIVTPREKAD